MSFWAKKQGFLVKLPKGVDQKTGMMTFEGVMLRYLTLIRECRDGLFDLTSAKDNGQ
jgi:hypothetical protein